MEESILKTVKKLLGLDESYEVFDQDIYAWTNSVFAILQDVGIGPMGGFVLESPDQTWNDFLQGEDSLFQDVKAYIAIKVRLLFDPPSMSFRIKLLEDQAQEFLWRMEARRDKIAHPWNLKEEPWLIVD